MTDKDLYGGLIRQHILHHAAEEPIFGLAAGECFVSADCVAAREERASQRWRDVAFPFHEHTCQIGLGAASAHATL